MGLFCTQLSHSSVRGGLPYFYLRPAVFFSVWDRSGLDQASRSQQNHYTPCPCETAGQMCSTSAANKGLSSTRTLTHCMVMRPSGGKHRSGSVPNKTKTGLFCFMDCSVREYLIVRLLACERGVWLTMYTVC